MPTLTEAAHNRLDELAERGRACTRPQRPCLSEAVVRVALTTVYSDGTPVTHLLPLCAPHGREIVSGRSRVRDVTEVHAHLLPEED